MKITEIKTLVERQPFRPFVIETTGGKQILISQQRNILLPEAKPELVIAFTDDGQMHLVEDEAIASVASS